MSGEKATSPCNKFQANIFNKTKCQNCFKSRELHLLNDGDMEQAKPVYGGWLCLAPEGTDFDNPMQRSRKWQRRFFILYEHGSLSFALDELPSTLPQGTVNMNLCTEITDAEPRTAQKNALCIITPEQEIFIRGDNKEIINGWSEQLSVYLRINKQNQNKKRKVETVATQEPSPAKMAATDPSFPSSESCAVSSRWQEDQLSRRPDVAPVWTVPDPPGPEQTPAGKTSAQLCPGSKESMTSNSATSFCGPVLDLLVDGNADPGSNHQLAESNNMNSLTNDRNKSRSSGSAAEGILGLEATRSEQEEGTAVSRKGRSEARTNKREKLQSCGDISQLSVPHPHRRAKSLDGRTSDNAMTPDLLNFKKGWMVKLDENDQWKKYWFVLSTDSLRFYKDSVAEEASDVEGEIDLTMCYNVSEYQVQRNYGFQIHTSKAVFTLSAMTAGIRRNWIQALMKNVHPANAPDVATLPGHHVPCSPSDSLPKPDVTQESDVSADVSAERNSHPKPRSVTERRREGRYKTFDWADFRPQTRRKQEADQTQKAKPSCSLEMGELERRKRREQRRSRYESMLGFSLGWEDVTEKTAGGGLRARGPTSQRRVEEEIEECWKQVETTKIRLEKSVPLFSEDTAEMEKLLDSYKKWAEDLEAKLEESEQSRRKLETVVAAGHWQQKLDPSVIIKADWEKSPNLQTLNLKDACENAEGLNIIPQDNKEQLGYSSPLLAPSIWLHDTEGNFQELGGFLPDKETVLPPYPDNQDLLSLGEVSEPTLSVASNRNRDDDEPPLTSDTQINTSECSSGSLIQDKADDTSLNCCLEQHIPPDQAIVGRLSQEVELLTLQNEALNQRNQEMVNQLTEADREIERLKSELSSRYADCAHRLPEEEQQGTRRVEALERELGLRNQELSEAQTLIASLEESLREAESVLQMNIPAAAEERGELRSACVSKAEEYLLKCFETTEAKLAELERQLSQSELTCRELQARSMELKEVEELQCQTTAEVNADISLRDQRSEEERVMDRNQSVPGVERIQKVMEVMVMRLEALRKLLEVADRLEFERESEHENEATVVSQTRWEESFWSELLSKLQAGVSPTREEKLAEMLLSDVIEHVILEKQVLLLGHDLLCGRDEGDTSEALKDLDIIRNNVGFIATEINKVDESGLLGFTDQMWDVQRSGAVAQKISLLTQLTSRLGARVPEKLQVTADRLYNFYFSDKTWSGFVHSAATEALYCCRLSRLRSEYEREREEAKSALLTLPLNCSSCVKLMKENQELEAKCQQASACVSKTDRCCQTEEPEPDTELKIKGKGAQEENVQQTFDTTEESMEVLPSDQLGIQEVSEQTAQKSEKETAPMEETDQVSALRRNVSELEELLSVITMEMKEDFDGQMCSVQMQHESEMEKLRATCQRGLSSIQESHYKLVEELQRQHQQEVERLLVERDRLLEEESAATATAIKAIKNAHLLELEREFQRRQSETSDENILLENIYRQHREELAAYQRELEVLSQQFSLKCLENGHLVQALDAERKALCQCQQENQDLRTRNQELSGHLAEEITRLCSLAKQDDLLLSQGMDVYEMEITLRVKESEVQCLKQVITSLKEDLQSAQKDKRNATKKYKDMYTELSIVRAKAERDTNELRENLRLAHQALGRTSPL